MALNAAIVWEVRTGGSDNSGGGFKADASGTDYSQQDAAQKSGTDLAIHASDSTKVQPVAAGVAAADIGNVIQITAGTNFTTGFYEITAQDGTYWTLDRSAGTVGSTGGTYAMGGALASPGKAGSAAVAGNSCYIKSGTYSITSASANVANGCVSWPTHATNVPRIVGYQTTRNDWGTRPTLQASGISSFTLITLNTHTRLENVIVDGANLTSSRGVGTSGNVVNMAIGVKVINCKNTGMDVNIVIRCEATGCSTAGSGIACGSAHLCFSHDNTVTGFGAITFGGPYFFSHCIAANNTGASSDGWGSPGIVRRWINCVAYGNGRHGFFAGSGPGETLLNCLAVNNGGYGFNNSWNTDAAMALNCAGYNNTSGNFSSFFTSLSNLNSVTLSADPFTNAAGNNFSLNSTAGGGAALKAAGVPGVFPDGTTTGYLDIGAAQHADPAVSGEAGYQMGVI